MELSIIIVSYNSDLYIKNCIESILTYNINHSHEILVVDNNSNDSTQRIV